MKFVNIFILLITYFSLTFCITPVGKNPISKIIAHNKNSTKPIKKGQPKRRQEIILMDSEVSTLVEVPVSYTTGISFYYPYFYKTHLISFAEDSNNFFTENYSFNDTCADTNCDVCNKKNNTICERCGTGLFLNTDKCVVSCPLNKTADILRAKCMNNNETSANVDILYSMAYSIGSCSNKCGKTILDCSCDVSCKLMGNCCTDYDTINCDLITDKNTKVDKSECKKINCEACEQNNNKTLKCNRCADSFYLINQTCVSTCPEKYENDDVNRICNKNNSLCRKQIPNCEQCFNLNVFDDKENSTKKDNLCQKCQKGYFIYQNKCVEKCPSGYRADRITWSCLQPPVFSWYWIYPSKGSCKDNCINGKQSDCSCINDCVQLGNCCADYDFYCGNTAFYR